MEGHNPVFDAAQAAIAAGLSVIPIKADGSKGASAPWKRWQQRRPTLAQLRTWWLRNAEYGLALICGRVSQGLETLDFDQPDIFARFIAAAQAVGLGDLVARIQAGYCERSPNDGQHLPYHCSVIAGNQVLAATREKTLIETRGEGGYFICAPSCGAVHPSGKPYVLLSGTFATIATITPEERKDLLDLARTFDERPRRNLAAAAVTVSSSSSQGDRPGDLYNQRASWDEILTPHGWVAVYQRGEETYWRRPGKAQGISATTNFAGSDLLYVFSTSTVFEPEHGYPKFRAYAVLNHGQDYRAAARALADLYGLPYGNGWATDEDAPPVDAWVEPLAPPVREPPPAEPQAEPFTDDAREEPQEEPQPEPQPEPKAEPQPQAEPAPASYSLPSFVWDELWLQQAEIAQEYSPRVWLATYAGFGALAQQRLRSFFYQPMYGQVYCLLVAPTGSGKGLPARMIEHMLPPEYAISTGVNSGEGLLYVIAEEIPPVKQLGQLRPTYRPVPSLLLLREWTTLTKYAGIKMATLIENHNNCFQSEGAYTQARSGLNIAGGRIKIFDPILSIFATTTPKGFSQALQSNSNLLDQGFVNRYLILPGTATQWRLHNTKTVSVDLQRLRALTGPLLPDPVTREDPTRWHPEGTLLTLFEPDALARIKEWGEATLEPLMAIDDQRRKVFARMGFYLHHIPFIRAWAGGRSSISLQDVEVSIAVVSLSMRYVETELIPDLVGVSSHENFPPIKAYYKNIELKALAKLTAARRKGSNERELIDSLATGEATYKDAQVVIESLVMQHKLVREIRAGSKKGGPKPKWLYLPAYAPEFAKDEKE